MTKINKYKKEKGFTIVELIVVMVVIAVLAVLTTVGYMGVSQRASAVALEADLKQASTALELYKVENDGQYPSQSDVESGVVVLPKSDDAEYIYTVTDGEYYLSASSPSAGDSAFHISSTTGLVVSGIWEGHIASTWANLSVGNTFTCGLTSKGKVYCWGQNNYGQLGNGTTTNSNTPVEIDMTGVLSGKTVSSISAGIDHTCIVASDNNAYCWGYNQYGKLGNNSTTQSSSPVAVSTAGVLSGKTVKSVKAGYFHTCAIASDDKPYCWGRNNRGHLGNNTTVDSSIPVAVVTTGVLSGKTAKNIAIGVEHSCVIASDDKPYCWGYNVSGQLGNNSTTQSNVPVAVDASGVLSGKTLSSLTMYTGNDSCVISSDNNMYCWGTNFAGQLGNGNTTTSLVPVAVAMVGSLSGKTITAASSASSRTCAIASGTLSCWGNNDYGSFGTGNQTASLIPVAALTTGALNGKTLSKLSVGNSHTCLLSTDNLIYCAGSNSYSQLGDGTTSSRFSFVASVVVPQ